MSHTPRLERKRGELPERNSNVRALGAPLVQTVGVQYTGSWTGVKNKFMGSKNRNVCCRSENCAKVKDGKNQAANISKDRACVRHNIFKSKLAVKQPFRTAGRTARRRATTSFLENAQGLRSSCSCPQNDTSDFSAACQKSLRLKAPRFR